MASTISRIGQHRRRPRWLAQGLDDLLARRPGQAATWLSWLRNAPQSPAERNILRLIGRLAYPARDRKSTRLTPVTNAHLVCRLLLEKKKTKHISKTDNITQDN